MIEDVKHKKPKLCQRAWVKEKMVLQRKLLKSIPLHVLGLNYGEGIYELNDCVGEEALSSNLPPKLGPIKKKTL
jgi:hypothetical protein